MPDVPGGSLLYNEWAGLFHGRMLMRLVLADDRPKLRLALRTLMAESMAGCRLVDGQHRRSAAPR